LCAGDGGRDERCPGLECHPARAVMG
jgi:hypothetical protein